jgi:hypothetical protein
MMLLEEFSLPLKTYVLALLILERPVLSAEETITNPLGDPPALPGRQQKFDK